MKRRLFGLAVLVLGLGLFVFGARTHADGLQLPMIEVSPTSHDFGNVPLGALASTNITVRNTGQLPLVVSQVKTKSPFMAGATSFTLQGGQARRVAVSFAPSAAQAYSGGVTFVSNANNNPSLTVPLTGTGVQ